MSKTDEIEDTSAPLIEHLAELRTRLIHSVMAFIVGMVICFTVATPIFNFLTAPLCKVLAEGGQDCALIFISPQEGFFVAIKISFLGRVHSGISLYRDADVAVRGAGPLQERKRRVSTLSGWHRLSCLRWAQALPSTW